MREKATKKRAATAMDCEGITCHNNGSLYLRHYTLSKEETVCRLMLVYINAIHIKKNKKKQRVSFITVFILCDQYSLYLPRNIIATRNSISYIKFELLTDSSGMGYWQWSEVGLSMTSDTPLERLQRNVTKDRPHTSQMKSLNATCFASRNKRLVTQSKVLWFPIPQL